MKFRIGWLVVLGLFMAVGIYVYNFFYGGEKVYSYFDRDFTLKVGDYAKVNDEVYVKLEKITDNRCKEETCEREGQQVAQVMVINDHRIRRLELGTLAEYKQKIEKTDYTIILKEINGKNEATFMLTTNEDINY